MTQPFSRYPAHLVEDAGGVGIVAFRDLHGIRPLIIGRADTDKGVVAMDRLFERRGGWLEKLLGK